jgi:cysteine-rich repeat protein
VNQYFISGAGYLPVGVAVDSTYIYWTLEPTNALTGGLISRANIDSTGVNQSFIALAPGSPPNPAGPAGVAANATFICWTEHNAQPPSIGRANIDGTGVNRGFIPLTAGTGVENVVVDASYIYWADENAQIGRANLDGTGVNQSFIPLPGGVPLAVAVDASYIYWIDYDRGSIGRANLDGTGVNQSFIKMAAARPMGLVVVQQTPQGGDGVIEPPETCDDGNTVSGDGCSSTCSVEPGWTCTGAPSVCKMLDTDGDGIPDLRDNCPYTANADQKDSGGLGVGSPPDGIGRRLPVR